MNLLTLTGLISLGVAIAVGGVTPIARADDNSFSGTVEKVWEDGFVLKTEKRSLKVDSWDVCGDKTSGNLSKDDKVTVNGEFDDGDFDASSITKEDGTKVCTKRKDDDD